MRALRELNPIRRFLWRAGRRLYTYARGDFQNNPQRNGEYWLLSRVLHTASHDALLLDVGANRGEWTCQALRVESQRPVSVHMFEPASGAQEILSARFQGSAAATLHPFALADTPGEATLYGTHAAGGTNALIASPGAYQQVTAVSTLDAFVSDRHIQTILMAKVDTEGFDYLVIKGGIETLKRGGIEVLQFEYNWRWLLTRTSLRDVFALLDHIPYRLGKLVGAEIEFVEEWHPELDRFIEANYVLVRRDTPLYRSGVTLKFDGSNVGIVR